jgi:chemotaxis protein MotB
MALRARRGGGNGLEAWPGYVDALSTLLMVVMFVLLVFVLAQAFESVALSKRNDQLTAANQTLTREREQIARLNRNLSAGDAARDALLSQLRDMNTQTAATMAERDKLATLLQEVEIAAAAAATMNKTLTANVETQTQRADQAQQATQQLTAELTEKARSIEQLRQDAAAAEARMREMRAQMAELDRTVKADKATIDAKLSDLARLMEQTSALTALRDDLEKQARTAAAATLTEQQKRQAAELLLNNEKKLGDSAQAKIAMLNQEVEQLRRELGVSEQQRVTEENKATGLHEQLNLALAAQVEELRKYRSDFFGRLRAVLADRPGIQIVGDRFVFQSEVLFGVSSADLTPAGVAQMTDLAATLRKIIDEIPHDVNWVLRIDGHTDTTPMHNARYESNWELSAARAITVVKFLITQGIPAQHLAATGFGENQPVDLANTPEARARNRRIEVRLTDR